MAKDEVNKEYHNEKLGSKPLTGNFGDPGKRRGAINLNPSGYFDNVNYDKRNPVKTPKSLKKQLDVAIEAIEKGGPGSGRKPNSPPNRTWAREKHIPEDLRAHFDPYKRKIPDLGTGVAPSRTEWRLKPRKKMVKSLDAAIDMLEGEISKSKPGNVKDLLRGKKDLNRPKPMTDKSVVDAFNPRKRQTPIEKSEKTKNPPRPTTKLPKPTNYVIPKKINPAKARARLIIQKSIEMLEKELDPKGFTPISDESLMKAFDGKIPDGFKATENRPSKSWLDSCLAKAEASEDDPKGYCMRLWVGDDEKPEDDKDLEKAVKDAKMACDGDKKEDIDDDLKKAITGCEAAGIPQAQLAEVISKAFLTKAVAEPIGSKFSPKARKPTSDNGGESEMSGHPSDADPSDLEPNAKEETK